MKPEELKLIAESVYPDAIVWICLEYQEPVCMIRHNGRAWRQPFYAYSNFDDGLIKDYREKLDNYYDDETEQMACLSAFWIALESPETLCQAYLKLIKGDKKGEAS